MSGGGSGAGGGGRYVWLSTELEVLPQAGVTDADGQPDLVGKAAAVVVPVLFAGNVVIPAAGDDNTDDVGPGIDANKPIQIARLTGFDGADWDRVRVGVDNADAQAAAALGVLLSMARLQGWNGAAFDRLRTLSAANLAAFAGVGGLVTAGPGEWALDSQPAAATQATVTRAAVAAQRHVCRSISVSLAAVAAQGIIRFNLRDGASGAGTVLWSTAMVVLAGDSKQVTISGLNIFGSVNTAMTLESSAAPAAGNFAQVSLSGYDAA